MTATRRRQTAIILPNRELRQVPLDWQHPRNEHGDPIPLATREARSSEAEIRELLAEGHTRAEIAGWFMPDWSTLPAKQLGLCIYETTTEGTPLSPVFPNTAEGRYQLLRYAADHLTIFADQTASIEDWARILGLSLTPPVG